MPLLLAAFLCTVSFTPRAVKSTAAATSLARPGEVLFVREVRRAELARLDSTLRQRLCDSGITRWHDIEALTTVEGGRRWTVDRLERFAWSVMLAAADAFGTGDAGARDHLLRLFDRWAKGRAMSRIRGDAVDAHYAVDRTLLPAIVAWWLVRGDPTVPPQVRRRVDAWLGERVAESVRFRTSLPPESLVARNNHALLGASVAAAWAALDGDAALLEHALRVSRDVMAGMRADGSLPAETVRGARALWYQRHALASLVVIAEIAAVQGIDLYRPLPDGRDLHRAVRFLLDAVRDPRLVWPYARANVNPGPVRNWYVQDLGFLVRRPSGRHYMAWSEIYAARFPDRPETERIAAVLADHGPDFRPMVDEYGGGNPSCLFPQAALRAVSANSTRSPD